MANKSSLTTLDALVRRLLAKEGKDNDDYFRYMQIACNGLEEFHIHDLDVEVTKVVTVNTSTNTFDYPTDYVRYTMIATPIDGRWWTFTRDNEMAPLTDDDGTTITSEVNVAEYKFPTDLSSGGGYNKYYFRDDVKNRRIQVGGFTPDVIVLKYVTNGIDSSGDINIPAHVRPALEAFVRWQMAEYDNPALSRIDWLERQYTKARRKMRSAQRPGLMDVIDAVRRGTGQGPRR
jgi:hypothetical protein